jgi:predicted MFS family arabinose efflux permease
MAAAVTALTLLSGLAGTAYAWTSRPILGLGIVFVGAAASFVLAEKRARDPIIPTHLFANPIFSIATVLGILAAVGMFAAVTYMPTYLQMVHGLSATVSGYVMLPMVIGIMAVSTASGAVISHVGRYRIFPIMCMATI